MIKVLIDLAGGVVDVYTNSAEVDILVRDYDIGALQDHTHLHWDNEGNLYIPSSGCLEPELTEEAFEQEDKEERNGNTL